MTEGQTNEQSTLAAPGSEPPTRRLLLLDGLASTSDTAHEWRRLLDNECGHGRSVDIFNYQSRALPDYSFLSTFASLERQINNLQDHVRNIRSDDLVLLGYSLGGLLALIGAANLKPGDLRRLSHVVVIAPAIAPNCEKMVEAYSRYTSQKGYPMPEPIRQLCGPDGPGWRIRAEASFRFLADHEIPLTVIHSRSDAYCPVPNVGLTSAQSLLVDVIEVWLSSGNTSARTFHNKLRDCLPTVRRLCSVLESV